jgi:GNAT superfamily N-acetyltransferase
VFRNDIALQQLWVEAIDGTIAGIAALTTQQEAEYMDVGWDIFETAIVTHRLAVHTHYQGRGIATALLLQAEREAARRNISVLRVDTSSKNMATQNLFPKLRYQFAGEITLFFRPCLRFFAMRNG